MIVVDASLATKWMLWEEDSPAALSFLFKHPHQLCAPDLLFTEVAAKIVRHANVTKNIDDDALAALAKWTIAWTDHAIRPHRVTQSRLFAAGRMAISIGHPLKDCIYLALAMEQSIELATCDRKFLAKALNVYPAVRLLSAYISG